MNQKQFSEWLDVNLPKYAEFRNILIPLLEGLLRKEGVEFVTVTGRPKDKSSALDKQRVKSYRDAPGKMNDLCGMRVVTFSNRQVEEVEKLLRAAFLIDEGNSSDRAEMLQEDKVGYRSVHIVATLGAQRASLPEYRAFCDMRFEVQIRTILQHAWAELAHNSVFKFDVALPKFIQRKVNLHSGVLELADEAFVQIENEVRQYRERVENQSLDDLSDDQIDTISLSQYLRLLQIRDKVAIPDRLLGLQIIEELRDFGIVSIRDVDEKLKGEFIGALKTHGLNEEGSAFGFFRDLMMYTDIDGYFSKSWKNHWQGLDSNAYLFLSKKYGEDKMDKILRKYDLDLLPE